MLARRLTIAIFYSGAVIGVVGWTSIIATYLLLATFIATYLLLATFLFASGGIVGDSLEGRIREEWVTPILGLIGAVITALGTVFAALA